MKPFYEEPGHTVYCGDCREVIQNLYLMRERFDTIITDPIWPGNTVKNYDKYGNPYVLWTCLLRSVECRKYPFLKRIAVQCGCNTPPDFHDLVSEYLGLEFFRYVTLEYINPNPKGRLLKTNDIATLWGVPPKSRPGLRVIPGIYRDNTVTFRKSKFPISRFLNHVKYLVRIWSDPDSIILDPFAGLGTTARAAKDNGRQSISIEIEKSNCEKIVENLQQEVLL